MKQYVCSVCGYVYDETAGIPEAGIAPGTRWEDLPAGWVCPICKADKSAFTVKSSDSPAAKAEVSRPHVEKELSPMEMSIICSNLSRGCEKQYLFRQAEDFQKLADFFRARQKEIPEDRPLLELIDRDLSQAFPYAKEVSAKDRGALRSLVWSEKVTRMLQSLLSRYEKEGDRMLENTGVYVCTVCGFVYVGDNPPELCPVCKVPSWKFEKITGRAE